MALREIIFRGKRLDNGEWVEGWYEMYPFGRWPVKSSIIPSEEAKNGRYGHVQVDISTVGQYTGLMDKNGERIFEGDVLKDDWGKVYEVFFNARNCSFMVKLEHAKNEWEIGNYRLGEDWSDTIRVIGNIHDGGFGDD